MSQKVFIDSDVILDFLSQREPFCVHAGRLIALGHQKKLTLYTTAVVLANVFYILRKAIGGAEAKKMLKSLRSVVRVLPIKAKIVDSALLSDFSDFEDALQYFAARDGRISILVTRNVRDYRAKNILVQTAEDYLLKYR
jgi:predicted nucleic acid-binding protein